MTSKQLIEILKSIKENCENVKGYCPECKYFKEDCKVEQVINELKGLSPEYWPIAVIERIINE